MTLAQVADESGLSLPYVSNLERGRGNPTLDALRAVAAALQQSVTDLLGEDVSEDSFDPAELVLAGAPDSLIRFTRSAEFQNVLKRLASEQDVPVEEMRKRLTIGMASAPRRSAEGPTEQDWRRLLDAYSLILSDG